MLSTLTSNKFSKTGLNFLRQALSLKMMKLLSLSTRQGSVLVYGLQDSQQTNSWSFN